jgi:hypothetical protein
MMLEKLLLKPERISSQIFLSVFRVAQLISTDQKYLRNIKSLIFSSTKKKKIIKKHQRMYRKYLLIIISQQRMFSLQLKLLSASTQHNVVPTLHRHSVKHLTLSQQVPYLKY